MDTEKQGNFYPLLMKNVKYIPKNAIKLVISCWPIVTSRCCIILLQNFFWSKIKICECCNIINIFIESVVYIPWEWLNIPTLQLCILKHSLRWVKLWTFGFFPKDLLYSFWILDINLLILFSLSIWFKKQFLLLIHWLLFFFLKFQHQARYTITNNTIKMF